MDQDLGAFYEQLDRLYEEGDQENIEALLQKTAAELEQAGAAEAVAVYNEMGSFYRGTSRYSQSLAGFEAAQRQIRRRYGTNCTEYATLLNNMAGTYRLMGAHEKAIELFLQAIGIYEACGDGQSYAYASVQNNISLVYQEIGQFEHAAEHLEKALDMIRTMPGHLHELAVTYSNLTVLYHKAGREPDARRCLNLALMAFDNCADGENVHYAAALNSLAGFLYSGGEYERAIETYKKAAAYTKRFFGENVEYAVTHQNMAWAYQAMGDKDGAVQALRAAEWVYVRLFQDGHERTRTVREELARLQAAAAS